MKEHKIRIVFGEQATKMHLDGQSDEQVSDYGSIGEFEFETAAEIDAFLKGISAMEGWLGWCEYQMMPESEYDEIITRSAPRWAWSIIDETLEMDARSNAFAVELRADIQAAITGMATACENADDEPISRADIDAVISGT